jgi:hypothetical protein
VFHLFCVSSALVVFLVNGGWDQPKCPLAVFELDPVVPILEDISKIYNFKTFRFIDSI